MKFKIGYLDTRDDDYPISPIFSIRAVAQSKKEAIIDFQRYRPRCVIIDIKEIE